MSNVRRAGLPKLNTPEATVGFPYRSRSPHAHHRELKQARRVGRSSSRGLPGHGSGTSEVAPFYRDLEHKLHLPTSLTRL